MTNSSYQSGVLVNNSPFLWIVPVVFEGGKFMGFKLDNYKNSLLAVLHYAESKELGKRKKDNSSGNTG